MEASGEVSLSFDRYKKQNNVIEQTSAPGSLTFHVTMSWHWLSMVCTHMHTHMCVCVSSPVANNAAQEVRQDKGQTATLSLASASNFWGTTTLSC